MNTLEKVKQWFIDRDLENGGRHVPTTNKNEALKVTKSRYKKEFSDKYIFRNVGEIDE